MPSTQSRRQFMATTATGALALAGCSRASGSTPAPIPRRALGKTGAQVSILGVGGSHLGDVRDENDALAIVHEAIDAGIDFFDNAWEYHDGRSEELLGKALAGGWRNRVFLMTKVCT